MDQAKTRPCAAVDRGITRAQEANNRGFQKIIEEISAALIKMPETDWPAVLESARHPVALKL
ncbi:MAG: hypothetical protein RL077_6497 [Verrucomicrobiota bacterium]|jgi:hypothetical protein